MPTISENLFSNGSQPKRIDQSINTNSQIISSIHTYLDNSVVHGAYAYATAASIEYLAATFGLLTQVTPTPTPAALPPVLSGFAVASNGLSVTYTNNGAPLTSVNGSYGINGVFSPIVLSGSSFTTAQIYTGDTIVISIFSTVPATTAVNNTSVTNNSTLARTTAVDALPPQRPLNFASFNLGATAVVNRPTITGELLSMAVSDPQLVSDFNELTFVITPNSGGSLYSVAFEPNSNFTRMAAKDSSTPSMLDVLNFYDSTQIRGGYSNATGTVMLSNTIIPSGTIIKIKKGANGRDLLISTSVDNITFTAFVTRPDAFLSVSTFFIKLIRIEAVASSSVNVPMVLR